MDNNIINLEDYQRFVQAQQAYQFAMQQPQMQMNPMYPQYMPIAQPMMIQQQPQAPIQQSQQQPKIENVEHVKPQIKPLKPGQANDLPFSDEKNYLEGKKVSIKEAVNKNIVVKDYRTIASKFKHANSNSCVMYQFSYVESKDQNVDELENYMFISGSRVLSDQINKYKEYLPFYARVAFINNKYYTFEQAKFPNENSSK